MATNLDTLFKQQLLSWDNRRRIMGDAAVGRKGEDYNKQADRIKQLIAPYLVDKFFTHGLDFGCGWGRFSPWLAEHCGHLWVADIFADWTTRAATPINTTVILLTPQTSLPSSNFDLIVDIFTLQSVGDGLFKYYSEALKQAAKPAALVISLHTTRQLTSIRQPATRATLLGLTQYKIINTAEIDDAKEPCALLVGTK